jgi:hypothetical protein
MVRGLRGGRAGRIAAVTRSALPVSGTFRVGPLQEIDEDQHPEWQERE